MITRNLSKLGKLSIRDWGFMGLMSKESRLDRTFPVNIGSHLCLTRDYTFPDDFTGTVKAISRWANTDKRVAIVLADQSISLMSLPPDQKWFCILEWRDSPLVYEDEPWSTSCGVGILAEPWHGQLLNHPGTVPQISKGFFILLDEETEKMREEYIRNRLYR